ncbi:MAG: hypothetical protein PHT84_02865 [Candidatus Pacebacteria bacterium]|nr:hypothetical protein [Candidatus Paceibacterota bacterium]
MDELIQNLQGFNEQVEKVIENKDFFIGFSFSFNYIEGKGVKIDDTRKIPRNIVNSFLVDFRPFLMNDSNYNFGKMCNLVYKQTKNEKIKENIREVRRVWNVILEKKTDEAPFNGISLKIDDKTIKSVDNLDNWLNGEYFHPDEKGKLEKTKSDVIFENISYLNFIDQLQKLAKLVIWFNKNVVIIFLDENGVQRENGS